LSFLEKCKDRFQSINSVLCLGLDPVVEKIPIADKTDIEKTIRNFYFSLIENFHSYIYVVKPNIAFYEQYGVSALQALKDIIKKAKSFDIPVILDAKRGDIGETAKAYAKAAFEELGADAITLSPYLGFDSLEPFFNYREKGFFILARTSNKGSSDFQLLKIDNSSYLYMEVAKKIEEWGSRISGSIGAVAGATHINELKDIATLFNSVEGLPLLIPGVGKQGGDFKEVVSVLSNLRYPLYKVFINSSSAINYAYLSHPDMDYLEASLFEIKKMML